MTKKILKNVLLVGTTAALLSFDLPLPEGWLKAGDKPDSYEMGIAKDEGMDKNTQTPIKIGQYDLMVESGVGKNCATIKSISKKIDGFGTLMQSCLPDKYLGKRVRMSGYLKSKDVAEWAGFWMRVDQPNSTPLNSLSFDNMEDRAIKGTTDWKKYEIVLDVPLRASNIAYGVLLSGTGQVWFDNLNFEVVDKSVPTTDKGRNFMPLKEPANLDFEK